MDTTAPTTIVIIGGAGDLAQRKLFPALFNLYRFGSLGTDFHIIGLARTERSNEEYQALIADALSEYLQDAPQDEIEAFSAKATYIAGSFDKVESYKAIEAQVLKNELKSGSAHHKLFYFAVPPTNYFEIFTALYESEVAKDRGGEVWSRILVEKPFGSDFASAVLLERLLKVSFSEQQIFRIDHYLAKEAVMNILAFRFTNSLTQSFWNKDHIAYVRIKMHEQLTVANRGQFYDLVGALRDVGQNHLLQLLALIAMERPASFTAEHIREKREAVLAKLAPYSDSNESFQDIFKAQYDTYTQTPGVSPSSETETYFEVTTYINDPVWDSVPFYLSAGKALAHDEVSIEIALRDTSVSTFDATPMHTVPNKIFLTISPVQSTNITLNMKEPGYDFKLEQNTLSFEWQQGNGHGYSAYEKIILDCLHGDQTLFTSTKEVLSSWIYIDSLLQHWDAIPLYKYPQGAHKPSEEKLQGGIIET